MSKDLYAESITSLLNTKENVKRSGFMLSPDVLQIIDILIYYMEDNKKLWFQLQHAWSNSGEFIEHQKEIVH